MVSKDHWDLVVLTAMDDAQKLAFELQLENLTFLDRRTCYRVYADANIGVKIGSGGATLFVIKKLHNEFGDELFQKRVLLIHAGGYSQRQPNGSALGKIFTLVPTNSAMKMHNLSDICNENRTFPTTLLQLKVEIYSKFLPFMPPGVFLASSDTLEYFPEDNFLLESGLIFSDSGFTVIAHPSPLSIAVHHGVYVLRPENMQMSLIHSDKNSVVTCQVVKILQKPTIDEMRLNQATLKSVFCIDGMSNDHKNFGNRDILDEFAFTDSVYFFASDVTKTFLDLISQENLKFDAEICAYGDFLRPLGVQNTDDYANSDFQRILFKLLRNFSIKAAIFNQSKFYHLGTFDELLHAYCENNENYRFFTEFKLSRHSFVEILVENDVKKELANQNQAEIGSTHEVLAKIDLTNQIRVVNFELSNENLSVDKIVVEILNNNDYKMDPANQNQAEIESANEILAKNELINQNRVINFESCNENSSVDKIFVDILDTNDFKTNLANQILSKNDLTNQNQAKNYLTKQIQAQNEPTNQNRVITFESSSEKLKGCVICSRLTSDSLLPNFSIVEKCDFSNGIILTHESILSNCRSRKRHVINLPVFVSTIPVITQKGRQFVTVAFDIRADLKKVYQNSLEIPFFHRFLLDFLKISGRNVAENDDLSIFGNMPKTLWYARLFTAHETMEESFDSLIDTLELFASGQQKESRDDGPIVGFRDPYYSMHDVLVNKDVVDMLNYYNCLCNQIISNV